MNLIIPYPLIILSCFIGFSDSKWGTIKDLNLENIKMSDLDNNQHNRGQHLFLSVSCRQSRIWKYFSLSVKCLRWRQQIFWFKIQRLLLTFDLWVVIENNVCLDSDLISLVEHTSASDNYYNQQRGIPQISSKSDKIMQHHGREQT